MLNFSAEWVIVGVLDLLAGGIQFLYCQFTYYS